MLIHLWSIMLLRHLLETSRFGGKLFNIDISKDHFFGGTLSVVHFFTCFFRFKSIYFKNKQTKISSTWKWNQKSTRIQNFPIVNLINLIEVKIYFVASYEYYILLHIFYSLSFYIINVAVFRLCIINRKK